MFFVLLLLLLKCINVFVFVEYIIVKIIGESERVVLALSSRWWCWPVMVPESMRMSARKFHSVLSLQCSSYVVIHLEY